MAACSRADPSPNCPQACPYAKESNNPTDQDGLKGAAQAPSADQPRCAKTESSPSLSYRPPSSPVSAQQARQPVPEAKMLSVNNCETAIESSTKTSSQITHGKSIENIDTQAKCSAFSNAHSKSMSTQVSLAHMMDGR